MDIIKEYFKSKTGNVTFIELKDDITVDIKGYPINSYIPLPITTDNLVQELKEGKLEEEVKISHIIEGIIYLMGIDEEFKYMKDYKNILEAYSDKIKDYIFYRGIEFIGKNDYDNGAIYFRALKFIDPNSADGIFNYALALEEIAKGYFDNEDEKNGLEFLNRSTLELESILDIDSNYALAYYKLGYHYKYFEQYLKAQLIWKKYIPLDKDEIRKQEIRDELEIIEDNVALESGLTYMSYNQFDKALDMFLKLLPKNKEWWELKYLIGGCYKELEEYEIAIKFFNESLELHKTESDVYNELGITLFIIGDIGKAIEVFTQGIENISDDYKLLFNRGLGYLQLGELNNAYIDISSAWELNPHDENVTAQKLQLEEIMNI
jgi:tetratricopeptide (TPR) repeat protein